MTPPPAPAIALERGRIPALVGEAVGDPALAARLAAATNEIEARLRDATVFPSALTTTAAQHLLNAGGKRLRPMLTLLAAELGAASGGGAAQPDSGPDASAGARGLDAPPRAAGLDAPPRAAGLDAASRAKVIAAAVATELTHLATLYHDDVIDTAPLRRGRPSAHKVWGNTSAILVGDLLLARASQLVSRLGPEGVLAQARTFERLCSGQLRESIGPEPGDDPIEHYLAVLSDKTASLLATSAWYGAFYGGAPAAVVEAVTGYGEKLGVAFQLADDVLDLTASAHAAGKLPGTDLRDRVPTMPVLLLRDRVASGGWAGGGTASGERWTDGRGGSAPSISSDAELLALIDGNLAQDAALQRAVELLAAHEVVAQTRELVQRWADDAVRELDPVPPGPVKDALVAVAGMIAARSRSA